MVKVTEHELARMYSSSGLSYPSHLTLWLPNLTRLPKSALHSHLTFASGYPLFMHLTKLGDFILSPGPVFARAVKKIGQKVLILPRNLPKRMYSCKKIIDKISLILRQYTTFCYLKTSLITPGRFSSEFFSTKFKSSIFILFICNELWLLENKDTSQKWFLFILTFFTNFYVKVAFFAFSFYQFLQIHLSNWHCKQLKSFRNSICSDLADLFFSK
ncbi:hypothetical protein BpHYR1_005098 [Brachionus plicatilis]|uniref:Uncharacterized protein n=1 Tax=Brachionus plicatilis TaxID=10195 RepID=A0A3M7QY97_BRAPC|nr:hypothetical protein BpHYR1_005098 [Brachionus plicatilis]